MSDSVVDVQKEADAAWSELAERHRGRLQCGLGCTDCCRDEITVFAVEAERIRAAHGDLLASQAPHPVGKCAMLGRRGECRIYDARPYVCRTQGLPLRWLDVDESFESAVEYRDICPLNEAGEPPLEELEADECWTLGPLEGRLAELQRRSQPPADELDRIALRALFAS